MKIGRKIGEGGNSEVFEWENNERIIKLAKSNTNKAALQREYNNTLTLWEMGFPVARPLEVLEVNNIPGVVFERIHGVSMMDHFLKNIVKQNNQLNSDWEDVRLIAQLLSGVHCLSSDKLPNQRKHLKGQISKVNYLNNKEKEIVIEHMGCLPVKNKVCHGDPNPNNIFMSNGKLVLIDWMDTTNGNPETDIAEFIIMIKFAIFPQDTPPIIVRSFDAVRENIISAFMEEYTLLTGITYDEVDRWIVPIAAQKLLADAISEEEKELLLKEIRVRLDYK